MPRSTLGEAVEQGLHQAQGLGFAGFRALKLDGRILLLRTRGFRTHAMLQICKLKVLALALGCGP